MTTLKYIDQIPHHLDPEVRRHALQIFRDSRSVETSWSRGNNALQHCERVAMQLVRTYVLMGNLGGFENAVLYAKVADLFGALWYFSSGCQTRIKYQAIRADLFEKGLTMTGRVRERTVP